MKIPGLIEIIAAVGVFIIGIFDPKWAMNIAIIVLIGLGIWRKNTARENKTLDQESKKSE